MAPGHRGLAVAAAALVVAGSAGAQDAPDPKVAMPVLLKVLTYDVNFAARGHGDFVVIVASESAQQPERNRLLATLSSLSVTSIKNRPLKFHGIEFRDEASLQTEIDRTRASAVLAVPGLSAKGLSALSEVSQDNQIYTLSLDEGMVEKALAVGVTQAGGRPQIVINEKASRAVGAKFESSVLRLARVIR